MKILSQFTISFLIVITASTFAIAQARNIPSDIDNVIVYRQGAQIERLATLDLAEGTQELTFSGLSADLDPNSVQVLSNEEFGLMSVSYAYNYLTEVNKPAALRELIEKRNKLEIDIQDLDMEVALLNEEKNMLEENREVAGENEGLNLQRLKDFTTFFTKRMRDIYSAKLGIIRKIESLNKEKEKVQQQIAEYEKSLRGKRVAEVTMRVESPSVQKVTIHLRYIVRNAGWSSGYDLRANSGDDELEMIRFANIHNRTEEVWKDVDLTLSTGNPSRRLYLPQLHPWWLRFREIQPKRNMEKAQMQLDGVMIAEAGVPQGPEVEISEELVTTLFEIDGKQDIPADGKVHRIRIQSTSFTSVKEYKTTPKIDPAVYLSAKLTNWEAAYLSPGEMKIYLDGGYVGKTYLDPAVSGDTLSVPLGIDEAIHVKREKVTSYSKKQFLGKNISERSAYRITVKSQRNREITLLIQDQLPVSTHQDISVEIGEIDGAQYDKQTGLLTWKIDLSPNGTNTIDFDFTVKYPKDKKLNL